jgi:hypothetical protein
MKSLMRFSAALGSNSLLAHKVQAILDGPPDRIAQDLASLSVELGTPFTAAEYEAHMTKWSADQGEEALAGVAGGVRQLDMQKLIRAFKKDDSVTRSRRIVSGMAWEGYAVF